MLCGRARAQGRRRQRLAGVTDAIKQRDLLTGRWGNVVLRPQKETAFHIQLVAMLRWALRPNILFFHCPNGGYRDDREGAKLKAMGVLPGISDLQFHWCEVDELRRKHRHVLHLELKADKGRLTDTQATFALAVKLLGDEYHIARSIDEAIGILGERGLIRNDVAVCGRRWA
jgi:hypothetical protein